MRLFLCLSACLAAGLVAGCDNGGDESAQENAAFPPNSETLALSGTLERSLAGDAIPAVTVTNPDGEELALADLGEPVLLNLWATWCAPCVAEMPLLDDLAADLDGQVRVVTVSVDMQGAAVVEPFFAEHQLQNLPMWLDPQNELAFAFGGGPVLPLTVLYDAQGHEVWRVIGAYDWGSEQARAEIVDALAESGG
ncbi:MAG: TlpA family protein disulfide reductase [Erythrobacter sp.]|nr:TlpA family protein disulfide reductase [Erythrobacter sp.]